MFQLEMLALFGLAAFLVAWTVNAVVGLLSGEKPGNTGSLWLEVFLRMFGVLELGFIGRILNYVGLTGWPRKAVYYVGVLCVLLFFVRGCHDKHVDNRQTNVVYKTFTP